MLSVGREWRLPVSRYPEKKGPRLLLGIPVRSLPSSQGLKSPYSARGNKRQRRLCPHPGWLLPSPVPHVDLGGRELLSLQSPLPPPFSQPAELGIRSVLCQHHLNLTLPLFPAGPQGLACRSLRSFLIWQRTTMFGPRGAWPSAIIEEEVWVWGEGLGLNSQKRETNGTGAVHT